jgi:DNA end-binding protein Ku
MLFADEVRPTKDIPTGGKKPSKKQVDNASAIIEELSTDWEPARYRDCYRERLKRVIDAKRRRKTIHAPKPEREPAPAPDLMAALEETLERLRKGEDPRAGQAEHDAPARNGKRGKASAREKKSKGSGANGRRASKPRKRSKSAR